MAGIHLPTETITELLCHLPVKSLLRFKSVSKSWYTIISSVSFSGAHIRCQRKNNHRFLIGSLVTGRAQQQLIEFKQDWQIQELLSLEDRPGPLQPNIELCHGDGLTVFYDICGLNSNPKGYAVWNPSTWSVLKFQCPYDFMMMESLSPRSHLLYGFGYDSLTNEYKFVICNGTRYVIFYCRNKCWSEVKVVEEFTFKMPLRIPNMEYSTYNGFFSESSGDFYWHFIDKQSTGHPCITVVCFDARAEKLKRVPDPPCPLTKGYIVGFFPHVMACKEGNLALSYNVNHNVKILVLKGWDGGEYSWTTLIDGIPKLPSGYIRVSSVYVGVKDEIIIFTGLREYVSNDGSLTSCLWVYNKRKQTFMEYHNNSYSGFRFIPVRENLFFSSKENEG